MAFVRELFVLLGFVLVSVFCADNDTTPAPTATTPAATPGTSATPPTRPPTTDLAQFLMNFPFSLWKLCKYGADTFKGMASSVMPPING